MVPMYRKAYAANENAFPAGRGRQQTGNLLHSLSAKGRKNAATFGTLAC